MAGTSCQLRTMLTDSMPRIVPQMDLLIPAGRSECINNEGIVGTCLNENPKDFAQGCVLHGLTTRSVVITIPVVRPDSTRPETNSTAEHLEPPSREIWRGSPR